MKVTYKVVSGTKTPFEKAINQHAADGYRIVHYTYTAAGAGGVGIQFRHAAIMEKVEDD